MTDPRITQLKELLETESRIIGNRKIIPADEVSNLMPNMREEIIKRKIDVMIHEFAGALPPLSQVEAKTHVNGDVYVSARVAVIPYPVLESIIKLVNELAADPQPPKRGPTSELH